MSQPNRPNSARKLTVPTAPQGIEVASFGSYIEAQAAVDLLSDKTFPVQNVTIVGNDLMMVERVTGRLTYGRVALAGVAAGMWFGLFVGILLFMFGGGDEGPSVLAAIVIGAGFGALFSLISYSFTGGKRDFTSSSQIVASVYTVLCTAEHAGPARQLLAEAGMNKHVNRAAGQNAMTGSVAPGPYTPGTYGAAAPTPATAQGAGEQATQQEPGAPTAPGGRAPDSMYVTPDGRPRYGVRTDPTPEPAAPPAHTATPTTPDTPDGTTAV